MRVFLVEVDAPNGRSRRRWLLSNSMSVSEIAEFVREFDYDSAVSRSKGRAEGGEAILPMLCTPDGFAPPDGVRWGVTGWDVILDEGFGAHAEINILFLEDGR